MINKLKVYHIQETRGGRSRELPERALQKGRLMKTGRDQDPRFFGKGHLVLEVVADV